MDDAQINLHLGRRLRRRRRALRLTQDQLAAICGVSYQTIQKYECAATRMSAEVLWRLSQALEVSISYFYEGVEFSEDVDDVARLNARRGS